MNVVSFIPARGGSKSIPNKNIYNVNGHPLIYYTIQAALNSTFITHTFVTSDSIEILDTAASFGSSTIIRPDHLATDTATSHDTILHSVHKCGISFMPDDLIVTLQPTSPLRTSSHIDECITSFLAHHASTSAVSCIKLPHQYSPESLMIYKSDGCAAPLHNNSPLRRQDKKTYLSRNGAAIYITPYKYIEQYIFGGNIFPYIMDRMSSIDIDVLDDIKMCEAFMSYIGL